VQSRVSSSSPRCTECRGVWQKNDLSIGRCCHQRTVLALGSLPICLRHDLATRGWRQWSRSLPRQSKISRRLAIKTWGSYDPGLDVESHLFHGSGCYLCVRWPEAGRKARGIGTGQRTQNPRNIRRAPTCTTEILNDGLRGSTVRFFVHSSAVLETRKHFLSTRMVERCDGIERD
jgi:hypothetical protein